MKRLETDLESLRTKLKSSIAGKQEQNNEYNDLATTKKKTWDKIECSSNKLEKVLIRVDRIAEATDLFEQYSYQYNVKITGIQQVTGTESPED